MHDLLEVEAVHRLEAGVRAHQRGHEGERHARPRRRQVGGAHLEALDADPSRVRDDRGGARVRVREGEGGEIDARCGGGDLVSSEAK